DLADPGCVGVTDNDETDPQVVLVGSSSTGTPLLTPFPLVRLRGRILSTGVTISLLSVRAPKGSKVTVTCRGPARSCPRSKWTKTTGSTATRVRVFERRKMRSGTILRIFVTKRGFVGKYTRFTIRRKKAPLRADSCSRANVTPLRCP
ncbi:MAG TPA: hypothetical protein VNT54_12565, partial [Solirubrobacteraceae bacterium]|nr:hypothetical protein [Solirubrobacteraceae bacterium]